MRPPLYIVLLVALAAPASALDPRLAAINDLLYVLQPSGAADIAAITASDFDLVVMDYSFDGGPSGEFTAGQVAALKASGKTVLFADGFESGGTSAWSSTAP